MVKKYGYLRVETGEFVLHRDDGPAVDFFYGNKIWYKDGMLHREDGPAVECFIDFNNQFNYYLNNECIPSITTLEEFLIYKILH